MLKHFLNLIFNILFHILLIHHDNPRQFMSYLTVQSLWGSMVATPCHWQQLTKKHFERRQNGCLEVLVPMLSFSYKLSLKFLWFTSYSSYHRKRSARLLQPLSVSLVLNTLNAYELHGSNFRRVGEWQLWSHSNLLSLCNSWGGFFGSLNLFNLAFKRPQQTALTLYQESLLWYGIYFKTLRRSQLLVLVIYCLYMYYQTPFSDSCTALDCDFANGWVFQFISLTTIFCICMAVCATITVPLRTITF